jgi:large subunit ribosomal protein L4
MTTIDVINASGQKAGSLELPAEIFDVQVNIPLIHQVVVAQLAAARQGSANVKNRGEVSGGGRKPYRQKGTGRARQGSVRAPQYAGGGVVHGPTPRSYAQRTPKKMKAAALRGALSDRAREGRVHLVESLVSEISTKAAARALARLTDRARPLVVVGRDDETTWMSLRNIPAVAIVAVDQLNTYDVVKSDDVVFTKAAYEALVGRPIEIADVPDDAPAGPDDTAASDTAATDEPTPAAAGATQVAGDASPAVTGDAAEPTAAESTAPEPTQGATAEPAPAGSAASVAAATGAASDGSASDGSDTSQSASDESAATESAGDEEADR